MDSVKKISSIDELLDALRCNRNIIVYGYKLYGEELLEFLMNNYYNIRPSSYSGKIRCFATSFDSYESRKGYAEVKGLSVKVISELQDYAESDLVIVATKEEQHSAMLETLMKYGFKNIVAITDICFYELQSVNRLVSGQARLEVMNYSLCHQNKLSSLRRKVANGHKVKVLFMTQRNTMFGCNSIYNIMEQSALFEPCVLVFSKRDKLDEKWKVEVEEDFQKFKEQGYRVVSAYDEYGYPVDLDMYEPDIVFFDCPNLHATSGMSHIRNDRINWKYLTCYMPYGCLMANSFYYHYENINIRQAWKCFFDTKESYKKAISEAEFNASNAVLAGYPKLDDYKIDRKLNIPAKIDNGKKIVIYSPHWTIECNNRYSTFHKYYKYFLELVKSMPDVNFVFKPHPQLGHRIKLMEEANQKIGISYEEYQEYIKEWAQLPNGYYCNDGDYIDLFKASSCMITDCGSFIGEYLLSENPCIYLLNPDNKEQMQGYTKTAKQILEQYYLCNSLEDIKKYVQRVIVDGTDDKKGNRLKIANDEFVNIGNAGEFICRYLEEQLR